MTTQPLKSDDGHSLAQATFCIRREPRFRQGRSFLKMLADMAGLVPTRVRNGRRHAAGGAFDVTRSKDRRCR